MGALPCALSSAAFDPSATADGTDRDSPPASDISPASTHPLPRTVLTMRRFRPQTASKSCPACPKRRAKLANSASKFCLSNVGVRTFLYGAALFGMWRAVLAAHFDFRLRGDLTRFREGPRRGVACTIQTSLLGQAKSIYLRPGRMGDFLNLKIGKIRFFERSENFLLFTSSQ